MVRRAVKYFKHCLRAVHADKSAGNISVSGRQDSIDIAQGGMHFGDVKSNHDMACELVAGLESLSGMLSHNNEAVNPASKPVAVFNRSLHTHVVRAVRDNLNKNRSTNMFIRDQAAKFHVQNVDCDQNHANGAMQLLTKETVTGPMIAEFTGKQAWSSFAHRESITAVLSDSLEQVSSTRQIAGCLPGSGSRKNIVNENAIVEVSGNRLQQTVQDAKRCHLPGYYIARVNDDSDQYGIGDARRDFGKYLIHKCLYTQEVRRNENVRDRAHYLEAARHEFRCGRTDRVYVQGADDVVLDADEFVVRPRHWNNRKVDYDTQSRDHIVYADCFVEGIHVSRIKQ